eukprot:m.146290 g.146290  ORF g.146290 m.146290 type:complete len:138 (-) comp14136_c1_seq1:1413-1826(-)
MNSERKRKNNPAALPPPSTTITLCCPGHSGANSNAEYITSPHSVICSVINSRTNLASPTQTAATRASRLLLFPAVTWAGSIDFHAISTQKSPADQEPTPENSKHGRIRPPCTVLTTDWAQINNQWTTSFNEAPPQSH